jgi:hypothetical protein
MRRILLVLVGGIIGGALAPYAVQAGVDGVRMIQGGGSALTTTSTSIDIATDGVRLTGSDGRLTMLGIGNGFDEDLTCDFDTTTNMIACSTSTSVSTLDFSQNIKLRAAGGAASIPGFAFSGDPDTGVYNVTTDTVGLSGGNSLGLSVDAAGIEKLKLEAADLAAGACTANTIRLDTGGATRELCICNTGGTAYDCWSVTAANGPSD